MGQGVPVMSRALFWNQMHQKDKNNSWLRESRFVSYQPNPILILYDPGIEIYN
jgi:hypothetical protein